MSVSSSGGKSHDKHDSVSEGDEEVAVSISEGNETLDHRMEEAQKGTPVLPHFQYTREELMEFQSHPLSKRRPECLDPAFNNSRGVWDPERWHLDRKRSETPPDDERGVRGELPMDHKRRPGDPRERIRKEQDGIVLSPQRRSFNSGCYVNVNQNSRRAESPLGKTDRDRDVGHRDMAPTRRIGSGRILAHTAWDFRFDREKDSDQQMDYAFQRSGSSGTTRDRERDRDRDERYERRSFGREFDRDRDKDRHRDRAERNRYADRRRAYSDSREEEPEWFSGGPTSQHDTIELRGFEDIPEEQMARGVSKKQSPSQSKAGKSNLRTAALNRKSSDSLLQQQTNSAGPTGRSTPTPIGAITDPPAAPHSPISTSKANDTTLTVRASEEDSSAGKPTMNWEPQNTEQNGSHTLQNSEFNLDLDDILKIDSLPLLTNGTAMEGSAGSRFCQFFRRDSPVNQPESRRSSLQDELLNNIINDITEPNIVIPPLSESDTYFAPISPAANTATSTVSVSAVGSSVSSNVMSSGNGGNTGGTGSSGSVCVKPTLLLEMLQRGGQNQSTQGDATLPPIIRAHSIRDLEAAGKMQSVEELEARMRQQGLNVVQQNNKNIIQSSSNKNTEEDLVAFKKLMLSKSHQETPVTVGRPVTHQQAVNTVVSSSADQVGLTPLSGFGLSSHPSPGPAVVTSQPQMQIPQDLVMKLLQLQQQQQRQQQQQEVLNKLLVSSQQQQQQQQQQNQASSRLGHVPVAVTVPTQFQVPPPPSLSPLPPELQLMITSAQPSRELLQRPEAQAIIQGLKHGEITPQHLVQQLQNPAMQHRHREVLVSILKLQLQPGVSPRATSPHPHVQQPELLHQMMLQQQQQQHQQQQLRIPSPLNSGYCQQSSVISPNLASNPNTLSVQHTVLPHRVPTPRELIAHTQNIMQSALIKKKLEEQQENFRKRQEMQQSLSPSMPGMSSNATNNIGLKINDSSSPAKHMSSPTPLAFTPTSVLRKMTAEKEAETSGGPVSALRIESKAAVSASNDVKPQSVAIQASQRQSVSVTQLRSQQTTAPPWNITKQHPGRPIVKGNANFQYAANVDYQQQQQHRHNSVLSSGGSYSNSVQRSKMTLATPPPNMTPQFNSLMMMHRPPNVRAQTIQAHLATLHQAQHHTQQQQQRNLSTSSLQQLLLNQNFGNAGRSSGKSDSRMLRSQQSQAMAIGRQGQTINLPVNRDMSTSPTSNQLARWFSPELLAQARAGQLPDMPPIPSTQNMLSLEELERLQQASAAVHN